MRLPFSTTEVRLRHQITLAPQPGFEQLVSVSIGPSGELVGLWTDLAGSRAVGSADDTDGNETTAPMAGPPAALVVEVRQQSTSRIVRVPEFIGASPVAQPLPDGSVLVVGRWAQWRPNGADQNAVIYSPDGAPLLSACLGDGIEHVLATKRGEVWIGYHDMGIYGNNGWGDPGGPQPVGASGLVRFSPQLEVAWEFEGAVIDDCEALALADDAVWTYYYMEYALACVDGSDVRFWQGVKADAPAAMGVLALATDGSRVALAGGYATRRSADRVVVATLGADRWLPKRRVRLVLPDGSRLPTDARMQGLGDRLHVFVGPECYQVNLDEL